MGNGKFEGWYFKHQKGDDTLAFIPGISSSGAFVQMLDAHGSRHFDMPELVIKNGVIRTGDCIFSPKGISISLPGVQGKITYGDLTPLHGDIMGPFAHLPMQCRHGVISMTHKISGHMAIDGTVRCFDDGIGYMEQDCGSSFPRTYQWVQCNDFDEPCAIMASVAHIPFCGFSFQGCICAVLYRGREYRFATYCGVKICAANAGHIRLVQGKFCLDIRITQNKPGNRLRAPVHGQMTGMIRESCNAAIRVKLWHRGKPVFDLSSNHAMYEIVK